MAKFQRFAGNKPLSVIRAQCKAQGLHLRDHNYRSWGSDHITVSGGGATVVFNTFNGRFFGTTPDGIDFDSDQPLDGTPWFDALLRFFYVTKEAA